MGERVTGVRVTPISGGFVLRGGRCGWTVCAGVGSTGVADVSGGRGGTALLVARSVDTAVVVEGTAGVVVVVSSAVPGLRTINKTAETTSAAAAAPTAIHTVNTCLRRYQGAGAGSKYQVSASKASKVPELWPSTAGS
jgi:hypothetical protein